VVNLSIITATIPEREGLMSRLYREIGQQRAGRSVDHVIVGGDGTVGRKINTGMRRAEGRYVCVVDDDDLVSPDYIDQLLRAIHLDMNPDVVTFGIDRPGKVPWWLRANIKEEDDRVGLANHLCAWKREIALAAPCLPRNYGWDVVWYWSLRVGFPNLNEFHIPKLLYQYNYDPDRTRAQSPASIADSIDNNGHKVKIVRVHDGRLAAGATLDRMWVQNMEIIDLSEARGTLLKEIEFK